MGWAKAHELSKLLAILSKLLISLKGIKTLIGLKRRQNFPSKIAFFYLV